ncbi:MAG: PDZ domain-containing protein [Clostridia bacterium]|nr:PDZ domain-containing protein [Clostridia bacterium]
MRRKLAAMAVIVSFVLLTGGYMTPEAAQGSGTRPKKSADMGLMLLDQEEGVYVLAVAERSPADRAGVVPGDYLLLAGDEPLQNAAHLDEMMNGAADGFTLTLQRDEQQRQIWFHYR